MFAEVTHFIRLKCCFPSANVPAGTMLKFAINILPSNAILVSRIVADTGKREIVLVNFM